jgi:hypothetical protein
VWLQILVPLVVLAGIVGVIFWATGGSDGDVATSETSTPAGDGGLEVVLKGLIVTGALADSDVPATDAPASTPETTSAPTTLPPTTIETATSASPTTAPTVAPTTSRGPTTTPPPTAPPTSATTTTTEPPDTTEAPATTGAPETTEPPETTGAPETTEPPATTEPPGTSEPPATTEPPGTSEAPATTEPPATSLPSVAAFFAQWNSATTGTDVPTISGAQARELTGDYAGYYLLTLRADGSTASPQVGLVGTVTAPGSGQLAEVMLVWIPGSDDDSNDFYWDCFGVLVQAVDPGASPDEIADLASALGRGPETPPFTRTADVSGGGFDYRALTLPYSGEAGSLEVSAIEVR